MLVFPVLSHLLYMFPLKKNEGGAKMATLGDKVYGQWRFILAPLRTGMGLL
jgi:hypothetical protein